MNLIHCKDQETRIVAMTILLDICRKCGEKSPKFLELVVHEILTSLQRYPNVEYINAGFFIIGELPLSVSFKTKIKELVLSKKPQLFEKRQRNAIDNFVQKLEG